MPENLEETYEKFEKEEKSTWRKMLKRFPVHIIVLILVVLLVGLLGSGFDFGSIDIGIYVVAFIVLAAIFSYQKADIKEIITPAQAKATLLQELRRMMEEGELPKGEIHLGYQHRLVSQSDNEGNLVPDYYAIGFMILGTDYSEMLMQGNVDAFSGIVKGLKDTPAGFDFDEEKDILKVIPHEFLDYRDRIKKRGRYES